MRLPRLRISTRGTMALIGVVAVTLGLGHEWTGPRERCLALAGRHASLAAEYKRNARGAPAMLTIAAWHEHLAREYEVAAGRPWEPIPKSRSSPPRGFKARDPTVQP